MGAPLISPFEVWVDSQLIIQIISVYLFYNLDYAVVLPSAQSVPQKAFSMMKQIGFALLTAAMCAPTLAERPEDISTAIPSTLAGDSTVAMQAINIRQDTVDRLYKPGRDCCYDEVNLDRPLPTPRVERGPTCCWDPSNWD